MNASIIRTLVAIVVVGAVAAGCGDAPTAPESAGTVQSSIGTRPPNRPVSSLLTDPLSVSLSCHYFAVYHFQCDAYAAGGSGAGYSFTWSDDIVDSYQDLSYGYGWGRCRWGYMVDDWGNMSMGYASVQVTDSNGATAWTWENISCVF